MAPATTPSTSAIRAATPSRCTTVPRPDDSPAPAGSELRLEPEPTAAEAEAVRHALAALGLIEPPVPVREPADRDRDP